MADTRAEHIAQLAELIKDVEVAMFTTTGVDGRLYSRPLATQQVAFDGDLWFVITGDSPKVAEIALDPRVNVAYASPSNNDDRAKIEELWSPAMKLFFPGGKDDPNLRLIHVRAESAEYWDGPGTLLGKALSFVLSAVQDEPAALADNGFIDLR
ncbi:pyridoxamine 5'-phosphate oxidase family protein [Stenotrophomonas hibiscicola]|uniref:pyridoxamine 5'-phosphate oxidase family protein n=1 Tax=Stenotrophomonas hibiscicola TaxID=86189 RepID=UPI002E7935F1|nr:pyridoxamine 5'-phosphate oxidase family protein [[Pseudomonas] hibiscicola]